MRTSFNAVYRWTRSARKQLQLIREIISILPIARGIRLFANASPWYHAQRIYTWCGENAFSLVDLLCSFSPVCSPDETTNRDLFQVFPYVKTMCERDRIARFSCATIGDFIQPAKLTGRAAVRVDRRAFHYIRWYYLKRKTMLFQLSLRIVFPRRPLDISFCVRITWNLLHLMQLTLEISITQDLSRASRYIARVNRFCKVICSLCHFSIPIISIKIDGIVRQDVRSASIIIKCHIRQCNIIRRKKK